MMGIVTDKTAIQFRMLNIGKGPAVWSPRAQCDRGKFIWEWIEFIQGKNMERSVELARNIQRKVCSGANRPDKGNKDSKVLL